MQTFKFQQHTDLADSWKCVKRNSLFLFDDMVAADKIPLTDTFELIRMPDAYK